MRIGFAAIAVALAAGLGAALAAPPDSSLRPQPRAAAAAEVRPAAPSPAPRPAPLPVSPSPAAAPAAPAAAGPGPADLPERARHAPPRTAARALALSRPDPAPAPGAEAVAAASTAAVRALAPAPVVTAGSMGALAAVPRPVPRPARAVAPAPEPPATPAPSPPARRAAPAPAPDVAGDPSDRVIPATAILRPAPGDTAVVRPRRGSVCGNTAIRGETLAPIAGRIRGCGIARPVRVTEVGGVRLSEAALMDCDTAAALHRWVERGVKPAVGRHGGGVAGLQVAAHYVCRTRNHRPGARLSEHAKGKAIDIAAILLKDGSMLSVARDWRGRNGRILKAAHKSACGTFGTTLGPGSDGMHEDHLHLDTARHRNGPYCR